MMALKSRLCQPLTRSSLKRPLRGQQRLGHCVATTVAPGTLPAVETPSSFYPAGSSDAGTVDKADSSQASVVDGCDGQPRVDNPNGTEQLACVKCSLPIDDTSRGTLGKKSKQPIHSYCVTFYKANCKKMSKTWRIDSGGAAWARKHKRSITQTGTKPRPGALPATSRCQACPWQ